MHKSGNPCLILIGSRSSATITGATITGTGPTPSIAQNGIQVSDLATAKITGGSVSGNECDVSVCGPNGFTQVQSCGILLFDAALTTLSGTTVSANDIGVYNGEDIAWTFFAPPPSFTPVNNAGSHLGLHNRYENAYFDQGKTTLSSSTFTTTEPCTKGTSVTATATDQVLCATPGISNAFLSNASNFDVLLIGNKGNDQLVGTSDTSGETWIIGGSPGSNVINGKNGNGFIQERGNAGDSLINVGSGYTVAPN